MCQCIHRFFPSDPNRSWNHRRNEKPRQEPQKPCRQHPLAAAPHEQLRANEGNGAECSSTPISASMDIPARSSRESSRQTAPFTDADRGRSSDFLGVRPFGRFLLMPLPGRGR